MSRMATDYTKLEEMKVITPADLDSIERAAKVLSLEECYDLLLVSKEELDEKQTQTIEKVYKRGRAKGISDAGDALFAQMKTRGGFAPAEAYLRQTAAGFKTDAPVGGNAGFSFNVNLGSDDVPS